MADYTVTLTSQQESGFTRALTYINEIRAMENPPLGAITKAQAMQGLAIERITQEFNNSKEWERGKLQGALYEATPAQIAQIRTILGI